MLVGVGLFLVGFFIYLDMQRQSDQLVKDYHEYINSCLSTRNTCSFEMCGPDWFHLYWYPNDNGLGSCFRTGDFTVLSTSLIGAVMIIIGGASFFVTKEADDNINQLTEPAKCDKCGAVLLDVEIFGVYPH